jgi:DNA helicase-2/ATP-dependent DNA helicase PcrA
MNDHLDQLNPKQREAVLATQGPVLIIAGAGTGKTKTLTHRIYHLIHQGIHPNKILAITFTNKAAKEMRERVMAMVLTRFADANHPLHYRGEGQNPEVPMLKTFHSLGVYILRKFSREAGLKKDFAILDTNDTMKLIKESMERHGINSKLHEPRKIKNFISGKKSDGYTVDQFLKATHSAFTEVVAVVWKTYEALKQKESAVDFDDLLLKPLELVQTNPQVRQSLQHQWEYIHIDEYQDTNQVQYDLIKILAEKHHNLCVVGDTDQNIYSWRGANLKNILNFEKDYPDTQMILLEENYRSTKNILLAADQVIKKNTARIHKNLITKQSDGDVVNVFTAMNEGDEARHIAKQAKELIGQGVSAHEIAVLYRTNFQSRVLEEAFLRENVPYQLLGTKFFERKEIKDIVSYIRAARNRDALSDLKRIINEPKRGLGPAALIKIFAQQHDQLPPGQHASYQKFQQLLDAIESTSRTTSPAELVRFVIEKTGFFDLYKSGSEDEQERLMNLEELVTYATRYDDLDMMLEDIALQSDQDELMAAPTSSNIPTPTLPQGEGDRTSHGKVKLMTIHASKGLEFDHVFIGGLEQGLFPHDGFAEKKTIEDQEEERRLFYVALTRARKQLHLSYAMTRTIYGEQTFNMPSEFLEDIPEEIINRKDGFGGNPPEPLKTVYLDW